MSSTIVMHKLVSKFMIATTKFLAKVSNISLVWISSIYRSLQQCSTNLHLKNIVTTLFIK